MLCLAEVSSTRCLASWHGTYSSQQGPLTSDTVDGTSMHHCNSAAASASSARLAPDQPVTGLPRRSAQGQRDDPLRLHQQELLLPDNHGGVVHHCPESLQEAGGGVPGGLEQPGRAGGQWLCAILHGGLEAAGDAYGRWLCTTCTSVLLSWARWLDHCCTAGACLRSCSAHGVLVGELIDILPEGTKSLVARQGKCQVT